MSIILKLMHAFFGENEKYGLIIPISGKVNAHSAHKAAELILARYEYSGFSDLYVVAVKGR